MKTGDEELPKDRDERAKLIEHLLSAVEDEMADKGKSNKFIEDVRDQFDRRGTLTDGQIFGIQKFYARAV